MSMYIQANGKFDYQKKDNWKKLIYETLREALQKEFEFVSLESKKEKIKVETQSLNFDFPINKELKKLNEEVNESFTKDDKKPANNPIQSTFVVESSPSNQKIKHQEVIESLYAVPVKDEQLMKVQEEKPKVSHKIEETADDDKEPAVKKEEKKQEEVQSESTKTAREHLPQLQVIGQFHKSYILAQGDEGLYIIDQHAAQERYHYEQIRKAILSGDTNNQQLLLPLQIETTIYAVSRIDELNALLENIGIHFEEFW